MTTELIAWLLVVLFLLLGAAVAFVSWHRHRAALMAAVPANGPDVAHLYELLNISPAGFLVTRQSDGAIRFINARLVEQLGGTADDYLGRPVPDFYADPAERANLLALLARDGSVRDFQVQFRKPNGDFGWASVSATLDRFDGEPAIFSSLVDITAAKASDRLLRDAARDFRDVLQAAPTAIVVADQASGLILFCNRRACELLATAEDRLVGRAVGELFGEPERPRALIAALGAGNRVQDTDAVLRRADGGEIQVDLSARLSSFEGRHALIQSFEDVTLRRRAEATLRDSEANLRNALSGAPVPMFIAGGAQRNLLFVNERARKALRLPAEQTVDDLRADDFLDASIRAEVARLTVENVAIRDREALIRPASGPRFWAIVAAREIVFAGGPAIFLSFTDISEHKRIEREIAENRRLLRNTINAAPVWIAMLDRSGYYVLVNRPFETLTGRVAQAIEGRHFTEILPPDMAARHSAMFERCIEGTTVDFEESLDHGQFDIGASSEPVIFIHGKYSPVIDQDGTVSGGVLSMTDVTERQRAVEKLRLQFAEIERLHGLLKEQVVHDPLTGLFNRRYLDETLDRELARARREGYPISVIMLDIDHFKQVNDTFGHQSGDEVLKVLAALLTDDMREGDMACRYGGEEFTLVLPNVGAEIARERAEDWRRRFAERITRFGSFELQCTFSAGIAAFPQQGKSRDELVAAADAALYQCKRGGRNQTRIYAPTARATGITGETT